MTEFWSLIVLHDFSYRTIFKILLKHDMARSTSVTLGEHFEDFMLEKIKTGRFQPVSEVVRAGLRKLEEDETKLQILREKLLAGENSSLIDRFNGQTFIEGLHKQHPK